MLKSAPKTSMIEGPIWKGLILFAIPLLLGNLFQQLYNTVDSLVVGNFLGDNALAAVSSSGGLIQLLVGFFNGLFMGAGVLVANTYGSGNRERLSNAVHTTVTIGLMIGVLLTILGNILAPILLFWMKTPDNVMSEALAYFRVYFSGSLAFIMYNCCTGILQNVGDSFHPLIYLIVASVTNVILDLVFVGLMGFGVSSVAMATILSQGLSALLCLHRLCRYETPYQVSLRKLGLQKTAFRQALDYGIPSGFQNSVVSLANVVVQSNINVFGAKVIAGCGVWAKLEGFAILPISSFALALSTFVGQNKGAGEYGRLRRGTAFGLICNGILSVLIGIFLFAATPFLTSLFNQDPEIIAASTERARICSPFFLFLGFSNCTGGILRGAGKARFSLMVYLICWCVIRVAYITAATAIFPDTRVIYSAYPITWFLSFSVFLFYYLKGDWVET